MKVKIEKDRIRLIAECERENEAIGAMMSLYCAASVPDESPEPDSIGNDSGCYLAKELNYCCIPRQDDCEAHAVKIGKFIVDPTPENIAEFGPKTAKVLKEMASLRNAQSALNNVVLFPPFARN